MAVKIKETAIPANNRRKIETRPPTRDKKNTSAMASNDPKRLILKARKYLKMKRLLK